MKNLDFSLAGKASINWTALNSARNDFANLQDKALQAYEIDKRNHTERFKVIADIAHGIMTSAYNNIPIPKFEPNVKFYINFGVANADTDFILAELKKMHVDNLEIEDFAQDTKRKIFHWKFNAESVKDFLISASKYVKTFLDAQIKPIESANKSQTNLDFNAKTESKKPTAPSTEYTLKGLSDALQHCDIRQAAERYQLTPANQNTYICKCGAGTGKKATGLFVTPNCNGLKCFTCGKYYSVLDLIAESENLNRESRADWIDILTIGCNIYGFNFEDYNKDVTPTATQDFDKVDSTFPQMQQARENFLPIKSNGAV